MAVTGETALVETLTEHLTMPDAEAYQCEPEKLPNYLRMYVSDEILQASGVDDRDCGYD